MAFAGYKTQSRGASSLISMIKSKISKQLPPNVEVFFLSETDFLS